MSRFLIRFLLFSPLLLIAVSVKPYYLSIDNKYQVLPKIAWTYNALTQSKTKNDQVKAFVIGDSVGNQLFQVGIEENKGEVHSATCSAAIDIVGQYILMYNYLQTNKPDAVVMMNSGFKFNLNAPQVFHYFLKTFDTKENKQHLTTSAKKKIRKVPYFFLSQAPHIKTTTWGPKIPFVADTTGMHISDLAAEYILKMDSLAKVHGVKFFALPPPIRDFRKPGMDSTFRIEVERNNLQHIFRYWDENLVYEEEAKYKDMIHLKMEYVYEYRPIFRSKVLEYASK